MSLLIAPPAAGSSAALTRPPGRFRAASGLEASTRLARQLAVRPELWRPFLQEELTEGRWYTRVVDTADATGWLILWAAGSSIEMHDHGTSAATVIVVQGELDENYHSRHDDRRRQRRLREGQAVSFDHDHIHQISNASPATAASLHVYSPPLQQMTYFIDGEERLETRNVAWKTSGTEGSNRP